MNQRNTTAWKSVAREKEMEANNLRAELAAAREETRAARAALEAERNNGGGRWRDGFRAATMALTCDGLAAPVPLESGSDFQPAIDAGSNRARTPYTESVPGGLLPLGEDPGAPEPGAEDAGHG